MLGLYFTLVRLLISLLLVTGAFAEKQTNLVGEWRSWGSDPGGARYSPLTDINRSTVRDLKPAWTFHIGDYTAKTNFSPEYIVPFEATPLMVDGLLYFPSPSGRVFAINGETGKLIWSFDSQTQPVSHRRKLVAAAGLGLGLVVLIWSPRRLPGWARGLTFMGAVVASLVTVRVLPYHDTHRFSHASRGVAYWQSEDGRDRRILYGNFLSKLFALNAQTGELRADFGTNGAIDLRAGVAKQWQNLIYSVNSPPAIVKDLVIVGGELPEFPSKGPSGAVRAFNVRTGKLAWTFHPIPQSGERGYKDWEPGSTIDRTGANVWSIMSVDAERGIVFLPIGSAAYDFYGADRKGRNEYANSLVALDAGTGKVLWYFQMVHHDLWDYDIPAQPILTTVRGIPAVVQITKMGFVFVLNRLTGEPLFPIEERPVPKSDLPGEASWSTQPFPLKPAPLSPLLMRPSDVRTDSETCRALLGNGLSHGIFSPPGMQTTIQTPGELGGGNWSGASVAAGLLFVNTNNLYTIGKMQEQSPGSPERFKRDYETREDAFFWDKDQIPCQVPPYGTLTAINLDSGEIAWKTNLPTINVGGSIATAGGLVFLGATVDDKFRAFDSRTGQELWLAALPASAHATPITYKGKESGKQFIVIAAGGGGIFRGKVSDELVAFSFFAKESKPQAAVRFSWLSQLSRLQWIRRTFVRNQRDTDARP